MWESVLAKLPGIFGFFATARFYSSKRNRRCAGCRFVTDAVGAQISIKKSRNFMRNGWGKPPMEIPHTFFEGEDVFMKGKMYLWRGRGRCIHEGEDVFMKGKMYLWRGRWRLFMKGKMYLWRGRCIYEGKMYLWREKKILEFLKKLKIKCFSKTKEIPGISHRKSKQISGNFERKIRT